MNTDNLELGPVRPPDEADSLLIRTTRGCTWNRCNFCTLFKDVPFSIRSVDEIKKDIYTAQQLYRDRPFDTCFLQDGDSFVMKTNDLLEILATLKEAFPSLKRISAYGRAQTMQRKSEHELRQIYDAGLNMLYCGVESGADRVLDKVNKGVSSETIISSALKVKSVGMELIVFVILGLGGKELSQDHVAGTADVLNRINPDFIRLMTLAVKENTNLGEMISDGSFTMLTESEMVVEQRQLIESLDRVTSRFGNYHGINLLTEVCGDLPDDKQNMLNTIDTFLSLDEKKKMNFIGGRRLGYYRTLADLEKTSSFNLVQQSLEKILLAGDDSIESVFHDMRNRYI